MCPPPLVKMHPSSNAVLSFFPPSTATETRRTVSQITGWESTGKPVQPAYCSSPAERTKMGSFMVPFREASRGDMSKMSTLSIFPRISRRSRPVDCSRSVGMVPGWAPGPTRSSMVLISVGSAQKDERRGNQSAFFFALFGRGPGTGGQSRANKKWGGGGWVCLPESFWMGASEALLGTGASRRTMVVAKERRRTGATAARRATATAERCRNMAGDSVGRSFDGSINSVEGGRIGWVVEWRGSLDEVWGSRQVGKQSFGYDLICPTDDLTSQLGELHFAVHGPTGCHVMRSGLIKGCAGRLHQMNSTSPNIVTLLIWKRRIALHK